MCTVSGRSTLSDDIVVVARDAEQAKVATSRGFAVR
jgi:hypothetical protein